jgi:hypothetical protein
MVAAQNNLITRENWQALCAEDKKQLIAELSAVAGPLAGKPSANRKQILVSLSALMRKSRYAANNAVLVGALPHPSPPRVSLSTLPHPAPQSTRPIAWPPPHLLHAPTPHPLTALGLADEHSQPRL